MNFLTNTYNEIKNSIYGPEYYSELVTKEHKTGLGYLLTVTTVLAIILGLSLVPTLIKVKTAIVSTVSGASNYYPAELTVKIDKGVLTTEGVTEPYAITVPSDVFKNMQGATKESPVNAVVIDTINPFSVEYFKSLSTFALVQKSSVSVIGDKGEIRTYQFSPDMTTKVTKQEVDHFADVINMYIERIAPFIYVLIIPIFAFGLFVGYVLYGIYFALITWLFARFWLKTKWSFKNSFRMGAHAMTLPILVINLLDIFYPIRIPFIFTIAGLVVLYMNFKTTSAVTGTPAEVTPATTQAS